MENNSLVIMVGGASSRMKRSLSSDRENKGVMDHIPHKSLIPVGKNGKPFLFYLVRNAKEAGYENLYLITSPGNKAFKNLVDEGGLPSGLQVFIAIQQVPGEREKPLGTADALQQCLDQYPVLKNSTFTVCNGDNLYSVGALKDLRGERKAANALISYASSGFEFTDERISKFAVMDISEDGFLKKIIEKPSAQEIPNYMDDTGELRVSMNIFSFYGTDIYPYLQNCPLDPVRDEKELPKAVGNLVVDDPQSVLCIPRLEHIPDLTDANDIQLFKNLE
ncbi:glucose-1-phosphate thymidylyltransferase [Flagellimonas taeanensis]|jgi:NDP-sugar pyrophosphorylase family protein|uniref:sugar phosphate nucleotidyltransferase n=1 Tax=Flavobacteriaceae TaxID=49546 RepID=UPI000E6A1CAC|nr:MULTISPECIES: sugar phosphate nucleotidyltransferase [Allomuricauda]MDC6384382.1 sugar phosphate nucleotidyltransferase [Muricauda sp. SK9]RIV49731.1 glucose-1-phosphate thymidylyltransferase [Allomuricauda taeanensis]RIV53930.1 glucose-1-phosphate thymidylyltransferase [Allomuricauda taeanensis]